MRRQGSQAGLSGWVAELSDGTVARQSDGVLWGDVRGRVVGLSLIVGGRTIRLPCGMARYFQKQSGSCGIGGGPVSVESRTVGLETPFGATVSLTASGDGDIRVEVS